MKKLRVWHIPQVPGNPFTVDVSSVEEAVKIMDVLADYDEFQRVNNIKPDYCNASGLDQWSEEDQEWESWFDDSDTFCDDPHEYMELQKEKEGEKA